MGTVQFPPDHFPPELIPIHIIPTRSIPTILSNLIIFILVRVKNFNTFGTHIKIFVFVFFKII